MIKQKQPPMLLGEPSPSLAKINAMNMVKLEAKITQLVDEQMGLRKSIDRRVAQGRGLDEQMRRVGDLLNRLKVLEQAARARLDEKAERKTIRERELQ